MYIGIALKWDYSKGMVQLSMPGYVCAALYSFQPKEPKRQNDSPYIWKQPVYGENNKMLSEKAPYEEFDEKIQRRIQKIVGNSYIMLEP